MDELLLHAQQDNGMVQTLMSQRPLRAERQRHSGTSGWFCAIPSAVTARPLASLLLPKKSPSVALPFWSRCVLAIGALGFLALLTVGRMVEPDPRGFGSHEQFGLPPCGYWERSGERCPFCGMTTAVAEVSRGRVLKGWSAHPAGSLFGVISPVLGAWMLISAVSGRPRLCQSVSAPILGVTLSLAVLTVLAWIIRKPWE